MSDARPRSAHDHAATPARRERPGEPHRRERRRCLIRSRVVSHRETPPRRTHGARSSPRSAHTSSPDHLLRRAPNTAVVARRRSAYGVSEAHGVIRRGHRATRREARGVERHHVRAAGLCPRRRRRRRHKWSTVGVACPRHDPPPGQAARGGGAARDRRSRVCRRSAGRRHARGTPRPTCIAALPSRVCSAADPPQQCPRSCTARSRSASGLRRAWCASTTSCNPPRRAPAEIGRVLGGGDASRAASRSARSVATVAPGRLGRPATWRSAHAARAGCAPPRTPSGAGSSAIAARASRPSARAIKALSRRPRESSSSSCLPGGRCRPQGPGDLERRSYATAAALLGLRYRTATLRGAAPAAVGRVP